MQKHERIRGRALQKLRARIFNADPLCRMCKDKGKITPATQLDHIVALTNGGTNDDDNLQGLCEACHTEKTYNDVGYSHRQEIGEDGWPKEVKTPPLWMIAAKNGK